MVIRTTQSAEKSLLFAETTTVNPYAPFLMNGQLTPTLPIFELSAHRNNIPMPASEAGAAPGADALPVSFLNVGGAGRLPPLLDDGLQTQHFLFKRDDNSTDKAKRDTEHVSVKREADRKDPKKRATISLGGGPLELGNVDTSLLTRGVGHDGLLEYGDALRAYGGAPSPRPHLVAAPFLEFNQQHLLQLPPKEKPIKKEDEPAEGEVMAIMAMCSGCAPDPFEKVNVISWQGTPKKLYSGVLYLPAKPECRKF